jgi:leucyl aminopeptidase (aminopeptidase T)
MIGLLLDLDCIVTQKFLREGKMSKRILMLSCLSALTLLSPLNRRYAGGGQSNIPTLRSSESPKITSVDQLMDYARYYVKTPFRSFGSSLMKPSLGVKPGDKVLLVSEITTDPLVIEAVRKAVLEAGGEFNVVLLHGYPEINDPVQLELTYLCKDAYDLLPEWVWRAMENANIVALGYGLDIHNYHAGIRKWFRDRKIRLVRFPYYTREILAMSALNYPDQIYEALDAKIWKQMYGAKQVKLTDPLGTDLMVELSDEYWETVLRVYEEYYGSKLSPEVPLFPGHLFIAPMMTGKLNARGIIVARAMHGGLIPTTKLYVENGRVVRVEGEGSLAQYVNYQLDKLKDVWFPGAPGPGVNFLVEIAIGTQPKVKRPPWEHLNGLPRFWAFAESRKRSGVVHIAWGSITAAVGTTKGLAGEEVFSYAKGLGVTVQHMDVELYHTTFYVDGKKIIENGHLLGLDDPDIRKIAAKYGDADELLREDWIPDKLGR